VGVDGLVLDPVRRAAVPIPPRRKWVVVLADIGGGNRWRFTR
jgi:hypothetical protein